MTTEVTAPTAAKPSFALAGTNTTVLSILITITVGHLLVDTMNSIVPAIYPMLKTSFALSFSEIGIIALVYQTSSSLLQPVVGFFTDRRPQPYSLGLGMGFSLMGVICLALTPQFAYLLLAVTFVGVGSAVFHPESSRVARMASGGRHGFAQSLFQVGGNFGGAMGPLLAALVIIPHGQHSLVRFAMIPLAAMLLLAYVGRWYKAHRAATPRTASSAKRTLHPALSTRAVVFYIAILLTLIFSKYFYMSSMTTYFTFYLMEKFGVSVQAAQIYLFVFLFASASGTFIGGPVGDRFGRKYVIWGSILGVLPFTIALPYANLFWTTILIVFIGLILSSALSAIIVFAQELVPGNIGMVAGLFFGFAFGMAGIGAAIMGKLADLTSIEYVYHIYSFLPAIGLLAVFLPDLKKAKAGS